MYFGICSVKTTKMKMCQLSQDLIDYFESSRAQSTVQQVCLIKYQMFVAKFTFEAVKDMVASGVKINSRVKFVYASELRNIGRIGDRQ